MISSKLFPLFCGFVPFSSANCTSSESNFKTFHISRQGDRERAREKVRQAKCLEVIKNIFCVCKNFLLD